MSKKSNKLDRIKECPWCGIKPQTTEGWSSGDFAWGFSIQCFASKCKVHPGVSAIINMYSGYNRSKAMMLKKDVIKTWNTRKKR